MRMPNARFERRVFAAGKAGHTPSDAEAKIDRGVSVITDDPHVLTRCASIDLIVEVTGTVEFGAKVVLDAIAHQKSVVMVNAELDSLVGPILKVRADEAGVVLTHTDGDEPGVAMTLFRYLQSVGLCPVAAGNIKGMVDHYRNPDTQRAFALQSHFVCRRNQVVDGGLRARQRDGVRRCPPGHGRAGMRLRA
jgi:predicted homoserine dehydrogenase-like protein